MKQFKYYLIAIVFMISCLNLYSQDREVVKEMRTGHTFYEYSGSQTDSLTDNQDTLDIVIINNFSNSIRSIHIASKFNLLGTADSVIKISILGENFDGDTYSTILASSNSSEIAADGQIEYDNAFFTETFLYDTTAVWPNPASTSAIDSVFYLATITPISFDFKRLVVRYIYPGDATGSGVYLKKLSLKYFTY